MKPTAYLIVVLATLPLILSACGGGGGGGSTATMPTAQATINGNPIPARPDTAANNATIKGIDTNSNGLRDDVEILVATLSKSSTYSGSAFRIAQLKNKLATENIATQAEFNLIIDEIVCLNKKRTQEERDILSLDDIRFAVENTRERSATAFANGKKYSKASLVGVPECN